MFDVFVFARVERVATQLYSVPKIKELLENVAELCHFKHSRVNNVKTEKTLSFSICVENMDILY